MGKTKKIGSYLAGECKRPFLRIFGGSRGEYKKQLELASCWLEVGHHK